jgi:hypothetical protein
MRCRDDCSVLLTEKRDCRRREDTAPNDIRSCADEAIDERVLDLRT